MQYYISPRFLNTVAVHLTKNYLTFPHVKVPLILGIHGRKGEGKTFQCELVFQRMGVEVVHMSAGELESPDAGDPARLIRVRYREAAELVRVRGKMAVLMINDLDAGAGRVDSFTQYTVNTQLVHGTLMNIADNPTNVQLPGSYEAEPIQRIPIIVTGNDFSTLYAPLIRDGRMEKFYWEPSLADRLGIIGGIFAVDGVSSETVKQLLEVFPNQAIDFFGALRSRLYDEQVTAFIQSVGIEKVSRRIVNSAEAPPEFQPPDFSLENLVATGKLLVQEQQRVQEMHLVEEYHQSIFKNHRLGETHIETYPSRQTSNGASAAHFYRQYQWESAPTAHEGVEHSPPASSYAGQPSSTLLTPEMVTLVNQTLQRGLRLGIEYVDERRFRTNSWQCFAVVDADVTDAIAQLDACLSQNPSAYVRLVQITRDRQRLSETVVQRPLASRS
jgi:ribulose bisphosphate carboxylase small subunit